MKLVASMIVRNEMDRYLPRAVEHLAGFCSEIRVLDDGSTDGGYEWLLAHPKVAVLTNGGPTFFEHEGRARQALLEWTLEARPEYVLSIDADEFVGEPEILERAMRRGAPVFTLQMEEVWKVDDVRLHIRTDGQWRPRPCPILWRPPSGATSNIWKIPDVKLACGREPLAVRRTRARPSGTSVYHFGWANESDRGERAARYFEHDGGRFHKDAHLQSILWPPERVLTQSKLWPPGLLPMRDQLHARASR